MLDLKGALDVLNAAKDAWLKQAADINALLSQGTEDATQQALALQEPLDKLQADYEAKKSMYDRLVKANAPSDVAKLFIPGSPVSQDGKDMPSGSKSRSEFMELSPSARMKFIKQGGVVVE